jgi:hypothetical protein
MANGLLAFIPIAALLVFVVVHSGARGTGICEDHGFTGSGALSWWPPGTKCRGGEPPIDEIFFSPTFFLVLAAVLLLMAGAWAIIRPPRGEGGVS